MEITVVHPDDLGEPETSVWRTLLQSSYELANPFLCPEFTIAVGRLRADARVASPRQGKDGVLRSQSAIAHDCMY